MGSSGSAPPARLRQRSRSRAWVARGARRQGDVCHMPADFKMHVLVHFNDFYFLDARADYSRSEDYLLPRVATVLRRLRKHLGDGVTRSEEHTSELQSP